MKSLVTFLLILTVSLHAGAQLISRFTWENNPATTAVNGANAISISSAATVSTGGVGGTKGLSPGTGSNDINLVLDGAAFNVPAIDISIDFRREESQASFFYRSNFNVGMNGGSLSANFQITNGTSYITINSGNVFSIPDDHTFHKYRFNYDNNTGVARIWADGVLKYTYNGTAGAPLYWTGAGNVTIGKDTDATGRNVAVFDNLVVQQQANALLPLQLLSFTAEAKNNKPAIEWTTTQELNVTSFLLERSADGAVFSAVTSIVASNGYNIINRYQFTDSLPVAAAISYYRLKMINDNGTFTYSSIKGVSITNTSATEMSVYPNPTTDFVSLKMSNAKAGKYHYSVSSISGQPVAAADVQLSNGYNLVKIDLTKTTQKGMMIIRLVNRQNNTAETFTVLKK